MQALAARELRKAIRALEETDGKKETGNVCNNDLALDESEMEAWCADEKQGMETAKAIFKAVKGRAGKAKGSKALSQRQEDDDKDSAAKTKVCELKAKLQWCKDNGKGVQKRVAVIAAVGLFNAYFILTG